MIIMDKIVVNSAGIKRTADTFFDKLVEYNQQVMRLEQTLDKVSTVWQGLDSEKFVTNMKERDIAELRRIYKILSDYGNYLRNIPDVYEALDEVYSGKAFDI